MRYIRYSERRHKMPREKKNGKHISLLLEQKLYDDLGQYCAETYLTKTATIEKALKQLFEEQKKQKKKE